MRVAHQWQSSLDVFLNFLVYLSDGAAFILGSQLSLGLVHVGYTKLTKIIIIVCLTEDVGKHEVMVGTTHKSLAKEFFLGIILRVPIAVIAWLAEAIEIYAPDQKRSSDSLIVSDSSFQRHASSNQRTELGT